MLRLCPLRLGGRVPAPAGISETNSAEVTVGTGWRPGALPSQQERGTDWEQGFTDVPQGPPCVASPGGRWGRGGCALCHPSSSVPDGADGHARNPSAPPPHTMHPSSHCARGQGWGQGQVGRRTCPPPKSGQEQETPMVCLHLQRTGSAAECRGPKGPQAHSQGSQLPWPDL